MPRCLECNSAFFKTLEIRVPLETMSKKQTQRRYQPAPDKIVYYKKRCKRCKYKFFIEKNLSTRETKFIPFKRWEEAVRVATGYELNNGGFQIMVGEYTRRMSKNPESFNRYLKKIKREKRDNPTSSDNQDHRGGYYA